MGQTYTVAEKMTVNQIFEKKVEVVFNENIFDDLIERGEVNEIGEGIYVFQGQFLKLMNFFDGVVKGFAENIQGIEQHYPTRWLIELFKNIK